MKNLLVTVFGCVVAFGCGDTKEANRANFGKAINAYFQKSPECLNVFGRDALPVTVKLSNFGASKVEKYDRFAKIGLLKISEGEVEHTELFKKVVTKTRTYELTDEGRRYYFEDASDPALIFAAGASRGFCYGKRSVSQITSFSEPSSDGGLIVSHVNFTYRISEIAPWASDSDIRESYKGMEAKLNTPEVEDKAILVKTGDGWVHRSMFKK